MRFISMIALGAISVSLLGCAESDGQLRHRISGEVSFNNKPIPYGDILFTPDGGKNNSGSQGIATIRDGKFDTSSEGKGISGGPMIIKVTGLSEDGEKAKLICEYEYSADLPREDSTLKIEVPADAANAKPDTPEI